MLFQLLLREKIRDVQRHAVKVETKAFSSVGTRALGCDCGAGIGSIKTCGFFRIRRLEMQMVDFEGHGILLLENNNLNAR